MPNYRPIITRDNLQQLEHYLYGLTRYIDSAEFQKDTDSLTQRKILYEVGFITMAIDILKRTFKGTGNEVPIVGWEEKNPDIKFGFMRVWHFTSSAIAGKILNINKSHITAVCRGTRKTAGDWCFKYKTEYNKSIEDELYNFDPNSPRFEIINIANEKKDTTSANGDV